MSCLPCESPLPVALRPHETYSISSLFAVSLYVSHSLSVSICHFNHYRLKNLTIPLNYAGNCLYSLTCIMRNVCLNISRPRRKTIGKIIFAPKALLLNGNSMSFVFQHELSVVNNELINNLLFIAN